MTSHEVNIFHFTPGWNGVFANDPRDVKSPLGAFTWRYADSTDRPDGADSVVRASLDHLDEFVKTVAFAILSRFPDRANDEIALSAATQLHEKIVADQEVTQ